LTDRQYAEKVSLEEPIDVSFDGKNFYIEDGHHRFYAAKVLNLPLKINLEIKSNPIIKLGGELGYDEFHRCIWKQVHNNRENMNEAQIMSLEQLPFKPEVEKRGGKIFSVGGAVRDEFLGKESKDLDVLITGISMDELEQILSQYGRVDAVGKSFGILKFKSKGSSEEIDIAIPRTEKPTGDGGHKGFEVSSDHALPIEKDLERRDFTINAIAKDVNGNIVDPYGGQQDLKDKIIRIVNPEAFSDDPLRMLRAVQFASRFGFTIEPVTMKMIQENASRIKEIPAERILTEFDKIVKKGNMLTGAQLLKNTGLFNQIFGFDIKQSTIDRSPFDDVQTMGEFIFLLIRLLPNPADYYKNNLKGDIDTYKEIKALDMAFDGAESVSAIEARSIAHNMYVTSQQSLQSKILPTVIETAAQELLEGKYPKTLGELAVNGNDLMALGLQGKEIGDTLKSMLLKIYAGKIRNNKEELLSLAGGSKSKLTESAELQFNQQKQEIFDKAISKGFEYLDRDSVTYNPMGVAGQCERNAYNMVKTYPEKYYPVGGYMIQYGTSFVEHWWVYDRETNKHIEVTPLSPDRKDWLTGYLGIINKEINDEIVDSPKFDYAPQFLKGGHVYYNYLKEYMGYRGDFQKPYTWNINGREVDIHFFVEKYDEWNNQNGKPAYRDVSKASILEFLQNNYEDFSHDTRLIQEMYWIINDRDILNEGRINLKQ
jgi:tRNA nucleotidyltransferase/poly(A) polymerase